MSRDSKQNKNMKILQIELLIHMNKNILLFFINEIPIFAYINL
jgi:hypothetical protein